ncbi:MAG: hypothetical protein GXP54_01945, partial [Deltaproteobacteria bacterium]|nr:hypothetical protein [Deltaproteobacteria bacterium]
MKIRDVLLTVLLPTLAACSATVGTRGGDRVEISKGIKALPAEELEARRDRYADVRITVDEGSISASDRGVLVWLVRAAEVMDRLFWQQASRSGLAVRKEVRGVAGEYGRLLRDYVEINYGPYDRLDGDE